MVKTKRKIAQTYGVQSDDTGRNRYNFARLKVGDAIIAPLSLLVNIRTSASFYKRRNHGWDYTTEVKRERDHVVLRRTK